MKYYEYSEYSMNTVKLIAKSQVILVRQFCVQRLLNNFSEYIHWQKILWRYLNTLLNEQYQVQKP